VMCIRVTWDLAKSGDLGPHFKAPNSEFTRVEPNFLSFGLFVYFGSSVVSAQGFTLVRRVLNYWRHTSSPFFAWVIFEIGSCFICRLSWAVILFCACCSSWDDRHTSPPVAIALVEWGLANFCPGWL
jgi:hypothetical protein